MQECYVSDQTEDGRPPRPDHIPPHYEAWAGAKLYCDWSSHDVVIVSIPCPGNALFSGVATEVRLRRVPKSSGYTTY